MKPAISQPSGNQPTIRQSAKQPAISQRLAISQRPAISRVAFSQKSAISQKNGNQPRPWQSATTPAISRLLACLQLSTSLCNPIALPSFAKKLCTGWPGSSGCVAYGAPAFEKVHLVSPPNGRQSAKKV
jgi:hypothetical protein